MSRFAAAALERSPEAVLRALLRLAGKIDLLLSSGNRRRIEVALERKKFRDADFAADIALVDKYSARDFMPDTLLVQVSRRCNLKCSMCGWAAWGRNKGFMSLELYKHVLAEAKLNGIKTIGLSNPQGEPLLSPHIALNINLALDAGFNVALNTNCTPLGEKNIRILCDAAQDDRFSVQASFSGYDKDSHEKVYAGSKFEETARKLANLNAELKKIGREKVLTVNGITMNPDSVERHLQFLESLGIERRRVAISHPDNFAGIVEIGTKDNDQELYSFKKDLNVRSLRLCSIILTQVLVYDDGKVSACACRDSEGIMEIGDLNKQSLRDIRTGPLFRTMVQNFINRNLSEMPLCQKCDIPYGDGYFPTLHYYSDDVHVLN